MLQIFVDPSARQGDLLTVQGSEYNHIRNVLRMKPGEEVSVRFEEDPDEYRYGIESFSEDAVLLRLRFVKSADAELPVRVYLFQGLPKSDKMELIVQKAVDHMAILRRDQVFCKKVHGKINWPGPQQFDMRKTRFAQPLKRKSGIIVFLPAHYSGVLPSHR